MVTTKPLEMGMNGTEQKHMTAIVVSNTILYSKMRYN